MKLRTFQKLPLLHNVNVFRQDWPHMYSALYRHILVSFSGICHFQKQLPGGIILNSCSLHR